MRFDSRVIDRAGIAKHVRASLEASLRRLRTDYIDLYRLHGRVPDQAMAVVLREMEELTASGAVRYFGCCGYMMSELGDKPLFAKAIGAQRLVSLQSECNLLYPSALTDLTMDVNSRQIGFIPFMPLGGGALTGKYQSTSKPQAGSRLAASASAEHRYLPIAGALAWRRYRGSRQKGDVRRSNCPLAGCCLHRAFHRSSQVQVDRT